MSEAWSQWEGQVIDGRFLLKQHLGGSRHSAVYLTQICPRADGSRQEKERGAEDPNVLRDGAGDATKDRRQETIPLAIKLITGDPHEAEQQLSRWRLAQILAHPHLLRVFDAGRCRLNDTDLTFGVVEYADENLGQILPQRPLTLEETRAMLDPTLDALAYLHGQGLVLGQLRPANVMAIGDELKLASDGICQAHEILSAAEMPGVYDAPETASGGKSAATDVWSLGMVLAEALTHRLPATNIPIDDAADPVLPENLPAPFAEIVRGCLMRDAKLRLTVAEIVALLHSGVPKRVPAEAAVAAPGSPAPSGMAAARKSMAASETLARKKPESESPVAKPRQFTSEYPQPSKPKGTGFSLRAALAKSISWTWPLVRRFALPLTVAIAALVALYAGLGVLHVDSGNTPPPDTNTAKPEPQTAAPMQPKPASLGSRSKPSPQTGSDSSKGESRSVITAAAGGGRGQDLGVVRRVLPDVPRSALDTIEGTVRVSVKVEIDAAGNVTKAGLVSPGPSPYFARLSLEAARGWKFGPAPGGALPFVLHFEYRNRGVGAFASRMPS